MAVLLYVFTVLYDWGPITFYVKARLAGKTVSCLDLPDEKWRNYEKCGGGAANNWGYEVSIDE